MPNKHLALIHLFLLLLIVTHCARSATAQAKPTYEIYAVRYATIPGFPVAGLVAGADPSRNLDIAMTVWLIRGNRRNIA